MNQVVVSNVLGVFNAQCKSPYGRHHLVFYGYFQKYV